jgi:hypothetical protein
VTAATPTSVSPVTTPRVTTPPSRTVAGDLDAAAKDLQSTVVGVLKLLGPAERTGSPASMNQLAQRAQTAHDYLAKFVDKSGYAFTHSGDGGFKMLESVNGFKNSMGALVAYAGDPSPATLALYTMQWQPSMSDWNAGVARVYAGSTQTRPTVATA